MVAIRPILARLCPGRAFDVRSRPPWIPGASRGMTAQTPRLVIPAKAGIHGRKPFTAALRAGRPRSQGHLHRQPLGDSRVTNACRSAGRRLSRMLPARQPRMRTPRVMHQSISSERKGGGMHERSAAGGFRVRGRHAGGGSPAQPRSPRGPVVLRRDARLPSGIDLSRRRSGGGGDDRPRTAHPAGPRLGTTRPERCACSAIARRGVRRPARPSSRLPTAPASRYADGSRSSRDRRPATRWSCSGWRKGNRGSWAAPGMQYRDLVPGRLGGAVIASHIRIPQGRTCARHGALPHHHLSAHLLLPGMVQPGLRGPGTPVPPGSGRLRHSAAANPSPGAGVIGQWRGDRAGSTRRARDHHRPRAHPAHRCAQSSSANSAASASAVTGGATPTWDDMAAAGLQSVPHGHRRSHRRRRERRGGPSRERGRAIVVTSHDADILFTFVLEGGMRLRAPGLQEQGLRAGDAFVVPPRTRTAYERCSPDLELLEVSLPGRFETTMHDGM